MRADRRVRPNEAPTETSDSGGSRGWRHIVRTFSAFSVPAYRFLWLSQVCGTTGMQMQMFARGLLAYQLGGNAGSIGLVSLGQAIPQFLFSLVGGTVADRFDRRKLMIVSQSLMVITAITIAVLVKAHLMTVTYLFGFGLWQGTTMSFGGPARQAFVPEVVGEKQLMNALALNNAAMNLSRIGAPSLAGALVAVSWIDLGGLYFIQAVLNCISLTLLFFLPIATRGTTTAAERESRASGITADGPRARRHRQGSLLKDLTDGFRYIWRSPILLTLLALGLVPTLLGQSYQQFLPVFAKNVFGDGVHRNAGAIGLMGTMSGVGALLGALTVATLSEYRRRTLLQLASGLGFGIFLACFAVQSRFAGAIIALVGVGFMSSFFQSLNSTMVMSATDPQYYGRVMSVNMLTFSLQAFGTFAIGYVIDAVGHFNRAGLDLIGVQATYFAIGLIVVAFIFAVTFLNPTYRRLEQDDLREFALRSTEGRTEPAAAEAAGS